MRVCVIASNTAREIYRQPAVHVVVVIFGLLIATAPLYTAFGFGAEKLLVREAGLATITMAGWVLSLILSSRIVHRELEGGSARMVHLALPSQRDAKRRTTVSTIST